MKDRIFGVLQRVGRSFMLPIAVLPVAGLLLGIGSSFTNATTIQTYGLEQILGDVPGDQEDVEEEKNKILQRDEHSWLVEGLCTIDDFRNTYIEKF